VSGSQVYDGREGDILHHGLFRRLALAALMSMPVMAQSYVWPLNAPIVH
jgi:hypothetical protein